MARRVLAAACFLCLTVSVGRGQITNVTNDQATPTPGVGHDYIRMLSETVNPANGSVSLRIQVPTTKGRGLTIPFSFAYDSSGVHHLEAGAPGSAVWWTNPGLLSSGGWSYSVPLLTNLYLSRTYTPGPVSYTCYYYNDYTFLDPSGGRHALGLAYVLDPTGQGCTNQQNKPYSVSAGGDDSVQAWYPSSGSQTGTPLTVADPDGTVYSFYGLSGAGGGLPALIEDRNGNEITVSSSGNGVFSYSDTAGRTVISSSGFGATGNTVTVSGLSAPSYTVYWGGANTNFVRPTVQQVGTDSYCTGIPADTEQQQAITSIHLSNGKYYTLKYETTFGLLNEIDYPTGGWVKYTWNWNPLSDFGAYTDSLGGQQGCEYQYPMPAVQTRTVSFDGTTAALEQDFSYTTTWNGVAWTTKTTTVTTKDLLRSKNFLTTYTYSPYSVPTQPNDNSHFGSQIPLEYEIDYCDWGATSCNSSNSLRTVKKNWHDQYEMTCESTTQGGLTERMDYTYGAGLQILDKKEWDWGKAPACGASTSGTPTRETKINYQNFSATPFAVHILDRPCQIITYASGGSRAAETDYFYDGGSTLCPTSSGAATGVAQTSSVVSHDYTNYAYNSGFPRGNATKKVQVLIGGTSNPTTTYTYDDTGQVRTMKDPCGNTTCADITGTNHTTTYSYTDSPAGGNPAGQSNAYLTTLTLPPTSGVNHIEKFTYNYADGQLASSTDQNSQVTSYFYGENSEGLDRLTGINYPDCTSCGSSTHSVTYSYNDAPATPSVTTTKLATPDPSIVSKTIMDGVGHVTETLVTSVTPNIRTDTAYDGQGRAYTASNPYYVGSPSPSDGTTTYTYDALGRATNVKHPDNNNTTTSYSGNCATVTDPQSKARKTCADGLGRLTSVLEDPGSSPHLNYTTTYAYDALDNLKTVTQGSQTRTFGYDSLSRLTSARNPEWTPTGGSSPCSVTYSYDANGNVASRVAPQPNQLSCSTTVTTNYTYDLLNRLTLKAYTNDPANTLTAYFGYDVDHSTMGTLRIPISYGVGRLSWTYTNASMTTNSYDRMGRVQEYWQCTPYNCSGSNPWHAHYDFDLGGDVKDGTHPAGFTLTNSINGAQQVTQISYSPSDSTHPANLIPTVAYTPFGAVSKLQNGCAGTSCVQLQETYDYNKRLQPVRIQLGTSTTQNSDYCLVYNYYTVAGNPTTCAVPGTPPSGAQNDGNVMGYRYADSSSNPVPSHTATYGYDALNRLTSAVAKDLSSNTLWSQSYGYDAWGNMSCSGSGLCTSMSYSSAHNNQMASIGSVAVTYDAAGNLLTDPTTNPVSSYTWDAEGRLTTVTQGGSTFLTNVYNAQGQVVSTTYPVYTNAKVDGVFDPSGRELGYYDGTTGGWWDRDIWAAGRMVAQSWPSDTFFVHSNHLHSDTQQTNEAGSVTLDILFYPWGQLWTHTGSINGMHFAGFQDAGGGNRNLYLTPTRTYANPMGRWLTPDPGGRNVVRLDDPQTWNMYAYVRNNPTTLTDPSGLDPCCDVQDVAEFAVGFGNAFASDNLAGAGRQDSADSAYRLGQGFGDAAATISGTLETLGGVGTEAGGLALDATIAGAPAGVVLNVAGAAEMAHGATTASMGFVHLAKDVSESSGGGPKAEDAPGVTAGGQATDKYGNKLGPSREPQVNTTKSNTREAARNKALNEGSGAVEHRTPKQGNPHFHPTDNQGKKRPSSTHHEYPD